jgi:hypothetical protein
MARAAWTFSPSPPTNARLLRVISDDPPGARGPAIVEILVQEPRDAASVGEPGLARALGGAPTRMRAGDSLTVDFGSPRCPLGALIEWGEDFATVFSVCLSDDGKSFREVGRIAGGDGGVDSFWWRSTTSRYLRLSVLEASAPAGAMIHELKLRLQNKDRMPIGALERAALSARADLYPQTLRGHPREP